MSAYSEMAEDKLLFVIETRPKSDEVFVEKIRESFGQVLVKNHVKSMILVDRIVDKVT